MSMKEAEVKAISDTGSQAATISDTTTATASDSSNDPTVYPSGLKLVTILACVYATVFLVALVRFAFCSQVPVTLSKANTC
jgi:hypothetical protein